MTVPRGKRALVLTEGRARGSLAAVRALHAAGWTVGVGIPGGNGMVAASRWCEQRHSVARPSSDGERFLEEARQAVQAGGYDVVFGGGDDWLFALEGLRGVTTAAVANPPVTTVAAALDKLNLGHLAGAVGFAVPRTEAATADSVARWTGPVVVKCRAHAVPKQPSGHRLEATVHPDVASARERIRAIREAGLEPILQEPIAGELSALAGIFHEGRLVGRVQQVSSRVWPTPMGVSARAETVRVDEALVERSSTLLAKLGWHGLVELQYLTPPGGERHLIDLNGRFYGSMELASAAGVNLPDAWGRQTLGWRLGRLDDAPPGVRFHWVFGDLRRAFVERRGGLAADLASTLRWSVGAAPRLWDVRDPGPLLHVTAARLRHAFHGPA